ncbi:MAG: IS4 family transposase [Alphaproteobacteria bacterium]|nr:IS4 family transposase [Alphaproteobacteria bacterium]
MDDGWREVIAPLACLVDLDATARTSGALLRRRAIRTGEVLLRLAIAWGPGELSLRQAAAWAGVSGVADLCDSALLRRLRQSADWMESLVQSVLQARAPAAQALGASGRLIRLVDGSTFGVVGSDKPGWRLHAGFDLPTGRMGQMTLTPIAEGEGLQRIAVTAGELRIADRGFARPEGLRYIVDHKGDFLVRMGSRSLKLEDDTGTGTSTGTALDLMAVFAAAERDGLYDQNVFVLHGRKSRKTWPPLATRLIVKPLPPQAAEAARERLRRAGQRERFVPSPLAVAAAGHVMLVTSIDHKEADAHALLDLYRLRWQVELAFKRIKSLLRMRTVPTKDPDLARTWLCSNLLISLLAEEFGRPAGINLESAGRN